VLDKEIAIISGLILSAAVLVVMAASFGGLEPAILSMVVTVAAGLLLSRPSKWKARIGFALEAAAFAVALVAGYLLASWQVTLFSGAISILGLVGTVSLMEEQ